MFKEIQRSILVQIIACYLYYSVFCLFHLQNHLVDCFTIYLKSCPFFLMATKYLEGFHKQGNDVARFVYYNYHSGGQSKNQVRTKGSRVGSRGSRKEMVISIL